MCGVTGWIDFKRNLLNEALSIKKMTETLAKRGPDDTNVWTANHVGFGHKRLTVVDPVGGKQPMNKEKNNFSYTICYNGELYNTEEIRKELLLKGYSFRGHSDTEVLLTAYIEWAENCVNYLNGIFAFAVWDEKKEQLFIARDRLGVKPLFLKNLGSGLLFGSELKAILAHPEVKTEVGRDGLAEIFGLGPSRSPGHGIFKGIQELRPGHALTFNRNGKNIWQYWKVISEHHQDSFEETVEKVRFLVSDAITRQLVSDVPLCTFLSGGVDSSAITAIAAAAYKQEGKGDLHTYSIDYEGNQHFFQANEFQPDSDSKYIQMMVNNLSTRHHTCVITQDKLVEDLIEAVHVKDLPGMADVDSSLLWFCREIKKDFVVSLSGECADEIFGGYPWFYREEDLNREGFPWMRSTEVRQDLLRTEWNQKLNINEYMMQKYAETIAETPHLEGESQQERKRRELFYLNQQWFMQTLLERKDRMSMGASLEVRVPFADHRLVEYVWNIPWDYKNYLNREKGLLRKALEGILPNDVLYRKKSPYPKTHNPNYTKAVTKWLQEILQDKNTALLEFFKKEELQNLIDSGGSYYKTPWYGQLMSGPQLLAHLAQIHIWFKDYNIQVVD
ncbi:asparagine synthase (glutamine-hydrolyzing) [Pseudoneobacillus sp. C159]